MKHDALVKSFDWHKLIEYAGGRRVGYRERERERVETMFELPTATYRLHPIDTQIHRYSDNRSWSCRWTPYSGSGQVHTHWVIQSGIPTLIPTVGRLVNRTMLNSNESGKKDTICQILSYAAQLTEFMSAAQAKHQPDSDDDPQDDWLTGRWWVACSELCTTCWLLVSFLSDKLVIMPCAFFSTFALGA